MYYIRPTWYMAKIASRDFLFTVYILFGPLLALALTYVKSLVNVVWASIISDFS